ncbi:uncharacterized protein LOC125222599 isoform X1 [Salvia hispanica]|uniref:uncharacterized protein LOC125222599 isoform X1 n=1 Tax=Salvia hispanica TaxID=49212 RepID=UPI00200995E3|nr:uncharacterized protein LOC125222599 isoform X1 [Salvia hispanica]
MGVLTNAAKATAEMPTAEGSDNGKILKLKDGEALCVLRDIFHGRTAKHGRSCPAVLFHVHLLSVINEEEGEKVAKPNPSSWFSVLEKYFAESEHVLKMLGKHYLEKAADHDALNASEMLRVLNLLCIHALGTKKLRNWIKHQKTQFDQKAEEAIHKVFEAKGEKIKEDAAKAIDARDGELEAIVSLNRSAAEQAHGKLLESEAMLLKHHSYTRNRAKIERQRNRQRKFNADDFERF